MTKKQFLNNWRQVLIGGLLIPISISVQANQTAQQYDQTSYCSNLPGNWNGTHIYESDGAVSTYKSEMREDGTLINDISTEEKNGNVLIEKQDGKWFCIANTFFTTVTDQNGNEYKYQYKILEIGPRYMRYQYFNFNKLGPIFEATKVE